METHHSELERNKAVIRRFVEEVQNQKNFDVFDELEETTRNSSMFGFPPGRSVGPRRRQDVSQRLPQCVSDSRFTIDDMIAEGTAW